MATTTIILKIVFTCIIESIEVSQMCFLEYGLVVWPLDLKVEGLLFDTYHGNSTVPHLIYGVEIV